MAGETINPSSRRMHGRGYRARSRGFQLTTPEPFRIRIGPLYLSCSLHFPAPKPHRTDDPRLRSLRFVSRGQAAETETWPW
jgi:hypothetical protein